MCFVGEVHERSCPCGLLRTSRRGQRKETDLKTKSLSLGVMAAVLLCMPLAGTAASKDYPERRVRIVVPYTPGTSADTMGRLIADKLGAELGQNVFVENR